MENERYNKQFFESIHNRSQSVSNIKKFAGRDQQVNLDRTTNGNPYLLGSTY